jgi:hypothetical protein
MKTAVEWLVQQLSKEWQLEDRDLHLIEQAKEMEFEQRKKDFVNGYKSRAKESNLIFDETSEKYAIYLYAIYLFNETFKSE